METKVVTVTPYLASKWLSESKTINRPISKPHLARLVSYMKSGKWKENTGEAIKFSSTKGLIDGHHRLNAIIQSGVTLRMLIVYDLDDDIFDVLDRGRVRSAGDVLAQIGAKNNTNLASGIVKWNNLRNENYGMRAAGCDILRLTPQDVLQIYTDDKESFDETMLAAMSFYRKFRGLAESEYFAIYHLLKENYKVKAYGFFTDLTAGVSLSEKNPAYLLREYLIKSMSSGVRPTTMTKYAHIARAWNSYVVGKDLKILKYSPSSQDVPKFIW